MHIHFETRRNKPPVFKITRALIDEAAARSALGGELELTLGSDLESLAPLATAVGLVTSNDVLRDPRFPLAELAVQAPALRWIHIIGAGIEPLLPLDWLPRRTALTNNSGVHVRKTGEFATMALLMLNARALKHLAQQAASRWEPIFTPAIAGRTLAVIGLGEMGSAAARAAKRLDMKIIGLRRRARPHRLVDEIFAPERLHEMLGRADFILVAAPLTPQTRNLIDRAAIASAKQGAGLINVGRAGVVDYAALCQALASGALGGAVLDVFDPEPLPPTSPLWQTPNLFISPHCSSDDLEAYLPMTLDLALANAARLCEGRPLKNRVDSRRGY